MQACRGAVEGQVRGFRGFREVGSHCNIGNSRAGAHAPPPAPMPHPEATGLGPSIEPPPLGPPGLTQKCRHRRLDRRVLACYSDLEGLGLPGDSALRAGPRARIRLGFRLRFRLGFRLGFRKGFRFVVRL